MTNRELYNAITERGGATKALKKYYADLLCQRASNGNKQARRFVALLEERKQCR